jgi:hypothetical protein
MLELLQCILCQRNWRRNITLLMNVLPCMKLRKHGWMLWMAESFLVCISLYILYVFFIYIYDCSYIWPMRKPILSRKFYYMVVTNDSAWDSDFSLAQPFKVAMWQIFTGCSFMPQGGQSLI